MCVVGGDSCNASGSFRGMVIDLFGSVPVDLWLAAVVSKLRRDSLHFGVLKFSQNVL